MLARLTLSLLLAASVSLAAAKPDAPTADLSHWVIEQQPGGTVTVRDGALIIEDAAGCTAWFREKITAPVEITYEVTTVSRGGPHDRVSDVNCFWMASDPNSPDALPSGRSGKFAEYDSLRTYYVGMGGWNNTFTRFRRYVGDGSKPLLPEHDLNEKRFLLEPNKTYRIKLVAAHGRAEFWRDGEKIFSFDDPAPLTSGWFAIRTVKSHLEIRNLQIKSAGASLHSSE
jgi:Farnesoic acid 0-methyl transferase.